MRILEMNIKNFKSAKDVTIPMGRELNQIYADDGGDAWDIMVAHDILFRAIKKGWKNISNVCAERMDGDSEVSALFLDEDDYVRKDTGELIPVIYKAVMKKKRSESWCCDIDIKCYYSNTGDEGPWTETNNYLIMKKIRQTCENIIMDSDENASLIRIDDSVMNYIKYFNEKTRADFPLLLPWLILTNDEMMGRVVLIHGAYYFVKSKEAVEFFKLYLRLNKDEKHISIFLEKKEHLDMKTRATIVHNGRSYEYGIRFNETEKEREEFYKQELERILSIKKEE